jgi:hypothetical protein
MRGGRGSRRFRRGQAMVEYSVINWLLIVGLLLATNVKIVPTGGNIRENVIDVFLRALQAYQDSVYYMLNLPFP